MSTVMNTEPASQEVGRYVWREFTLQCVREDATIVRPIMEEPEAVADYLRSNGVFRNPDVEAFVVVAVNARGRVIGYNVATVGSATSTIVHPREVFRFAILAGATGIICAHNHPSGDPSPSAQDHRITRILREAAGVVDIQILDHVIVGRMSEDPTGQGHYSFRVAGLL